MYMCDNKFSSIAKAVIFFETTEVYACLAASHTHAHTHQISSTGHLIGHPIKGATISPDFIFFPLLPPSFSKSDTALIISSLAYQLCRKKKKMQLLNCREEEEGGGDRERGR